jgi:hypothetical protein
VRVPSLSWARYICAGFCNLTLATIMKRGRTWPWVKIRPFLARFSQPVWSGRLPSWADCITTTPELKFSVFGIHRSPTENAVLAASRFAMRRANPGGSLPHNLTTQKLDSAVAFRRRSRRDAPRTSSWYLLRRGRETYALHRSVFARPAVQLRRHGPRIR